MEGKCRQGFERRQHCPRVRQLRRCHDCGTLILVGRRPHARTLTCRRCERVDQQAMKLFHDILRKYPTLRGS